MSRPARTLGPTYRLQLTPSFGFAQAEAVVSYLKDLGVEFAYLSPVLEARPGSEHGYDGTDPSRIRTEVGGERGFQSLVTALHSAGLGVLLDIVPNHLSTYTGGPWWRDVLRLGRASAYADVFDIDWRQQDRDPADRDTVLLPILGSPLEEVLERGELAIAEGNDGPSLRYFDTDLPLAPDGPQEPGTPLDELLRGQHYRLQWWREPRRNYRRFFTIDDLVGIRVEDPSVFELTHALVGDLLEDGLVDALRVDHVDGMADPAEYLRRLAELSAGAPIVVEKILTGNEPLRHRWPVDGTTGYEVADDITNALADTEGVERLADAAAGDGELPAPKVMEEAKRFVVETSFPSEVGRISRLLRLEEEHVVEAVVAMPVYRTYVSAEGAEPLDERLLETAGGSELRRLALEDRAAESFEGIVRYQQLTSAAMAKGVEDTAWYRLVGKLPFLEVGGDPEHSPEADDDAIARLHMRSMRRVMKRERGLVPGTTHDTKRSADVRARLLALAEMPAAFEGSLARFAELVPPSPIGDDHPAAPGPLDRRRIAETCLAMAPFPEAPAEAWAETAERVEAALRKGAREAKDRDSWEDVNEEYEDALSAAARSLLDAEGRLLSECFGPVVSRVQRFGATLSLGQVVLRSTLPGVPDCYQGDETWNFTLVDPDNRRPVPYEELAADCAGLPERPEATGVFDLCSNWTDGRVKMHVTRQCLAVRRALPRAFGHGTPHVPLRLGRHVDGGPPGAIAFVRLENGPASQCALSVVTRAPHRLPAGPMGIPIGERAWGPARLELPGEVVQAGGSEWVDMLSGNTISFDSATRSARLADVLEVLPVAVLIPAPLAEH